MPVRRSLFRKLLDIKKFPASEKSLSFVSMGKEPIITYSHKPVRHNMGEESSHKCQYRHGKEKVEFYFLRPF
jgi:hypothetical protein